MEAAKPNVQQSPDNQKGPLGPQQCQWVDDHYGRAFFRDAKPMVDQHQQLVVNAGNTPC